jgi:Asp-tRNA(Asn)/Glu-tRNA(Gln) amidotransferase B subunit
MTTPQSNNIGAQLEAFRQAVERDATVNGSASTLIGMLAQKLQDAISQAQNTGVSPEQLASFQALVDGLNAQQDALAAAVAANTPGA